MLISQSCCLSCPVQSICHPNMRESQLKSKSDLPNLLNSLQWLPPAKGPSPTPCSRALNTVVICLPLQAVSSSYPQLLTPSDWTACYPTRQAQASFPLFALLQEHTSSCPSRTFLTPQDSRCLVSADGHLLWCPFLHPKLSVFHLVPLCQTHDVPSELFQCDFHLIKVQASWRNHAYFSCTHD